MRIHVVHSCGHSVVVRRYTAFIDRDALKASLESRPCDVCMLARVTRAIKRSKLKEEGNRKALIRASTAKA